MDNALNPCSSVSSVANFYSDPDLSWSHSAFRHLKRIDKLRSKTEHGLVQHVVEFHRGSDAHTLGETDLSRYIEIEHERSWSTAAVAWKISALTDGRHTERISGEVRAVV